MQRELVRHADMNAQVHPNSPMRAVKRHLDVFCLLGAGT